MTFETEQRAYDAKLPELLQQAGKFAVLKGTDLLGVFDTYEEALKEAYAKYGLEPFFVRQIAAAPQVSYFARDLAACPQ